MAQTSRGSVVTWYKNFALNTPKLDYNRYQIHLIALFNKNIKRKHVCAMVKGLLLILFLYCFF